MKKFFFPKVFFSNMEDPFDPFFDALFDFDDLDRLLEEEERAKFLAQSRREPPYPERKETFWNANRCPRTLVRASSRTRGPPPSRGRRSGVRTYAQSPFDTIFIITDTIRRANTVSYAHTTRRRARRRLSMGECQTASERVRTRRESASGSRAATRIRTLKVRRRPYQGDSCATAGRSREGCG